MATHVVDSYIGIILLFSLMATGCSAWDCKYARFGQYECEQFTECQANHTQILFDNVTCTGQRSFSIIQTCRNGYNINTAIALSVFLGVLGVDRCYLGYPMVGIVKFFTMGFFLFGNIIDLILISTGMVLPADGSDYTRSESSYGPPVMHRPDVDIQHVG